MFDPFSSAEISTTSLNLFRRVQELLKIESPIDSKNPYHLFARESLVFANSVLNANWGTPFHAAYTFWSEQFLLPALETPHNTRDGEMIFNAASRIETAIHSADVLKIGSNLLHIFYNEINSPDSQITGAFTYQELEHIYNAYNNPMVWTGLFGHDNGKLVAIQDNPRILMLTRAHLAKLDQKFFPTISKLNFHPIYGEAMWRRSLGKHRLDLNSTSLIDDITRHHHEKQDGSGYPDNLSGNRISMIAQLSGLADFIAGIIQDRVYKNGKTVNSLSSLDYIVESMVTTKKFDVRWLPLYYLYREQYLVNNFPE